MNFDYVLGKSSGPVDLAEAFLERERRTRPGILGPSNVPMIFIPAGPGTSRAPARKVALPRAQARSTPSSRSLPTIRAARHSIAGYACLFGRGGDESVAVGAFSGRLGRSWCLLLNHQDYRYGVASLASTDDQTLVVDTDGHGLWFEAALPQDRRGADVMAQVEAGAMTGLSFGWAGDKRLTLPDRSTMFTDISAWELSLLTGANQPRFPGSWVRPNSEAQRRRHSLMGY